ADVVLENFRPGTLEKWGIGYDTLSAINPGLVMLSVSGFGQTGPLSSRAGYDRMGLAFSGMMALNGYADRPPVRFGTSIADYCTATLGAFAVMTALYYRDMNGGQGQQIDLALYESMFRMTEAMTAAYDRLGMVRQRTGNVHYAAAPGNNFETSEGRYMTLTCSGNAVFRRLCLGCVRHVLCDEHGFASNALRRKWIEDRNDLVWQWVEKTPDVQMMAPRDEQGVPYSRAMTVGEFPLHSHYTARK